MAFTLAGRSISFYFANEEAVELFAGQVLSFQTSEQVELDEFMQFLYDKPNVYAQVMARLTTLAAESTAAAAYANKVAKDAKRKLASARSKKQYRLKSEMLRISETLVPGPRRLQSATNGVLKKLHHTHRRALQMGNDIALLPRAITAQSYTPTYPRLSALWQWNTFALKNGVVRLIPRREDPDEPHLDPSDDEPHLDPSASSGGNGA
jgi:hypothetical protein